MPSVDVHTAAGTIRGVSRGASTAFFGIPFALPPVGPLRFAVPEPHPGWDGVFDATRPGPTPPQGRTNFTARMPEPSIEGDSFLVLNVFAPSHTESELPVLVFVHGGGFVGGSASSPWYDGAAFNRDGVITVSVSYRLGCDGFGWIDGAPGNRAIRDVIQALRWVRDNIASFGGDPGRLTLAGQSAGAVVVYGVLAAPTARSLYHRAWTMSGRPRSMSLDEAVVVARAVGDVAGVPPTAGGLAAVSPRRMLDVQSRAVQSLAGHPAPLEALHILGEGRMRFGPIVDGDLIPVPVDEAMASRESAGIPLVLGTTEQEFNDFADAHAAAIQAVGRERILEQIGLDRNRARRYGEAHPDLDAVGLVGQWITDRRYRLPLLSVADRREAEGLPTWLYGFGWRSPTDGRALHCLDLPFFFDRLAEDGVDWGNAPRPGDLNG
jgi:para-nitrobenzyl esterase